MIAFGLPLWDRAGVSGGLSLASTGGSGVGMQSRCVCARFAVVAWAVVRLWRAGESPRLRLGLIWMRRMSALRGYVPQASTRRSDVPQNVSSES